MNNTLKTSLVLCDLDHLLLGTDGNLPQVLRDVMQPGAHCPEWCVPPWASAAKRPSADRRGC